MLRIIRKIREPSYQPRHAFVLFLLAIVLYLLWCRWVTIYFGNPDFPPPDYCICGLCVVCVTTKQQFSCIQECSIFICVELTEYSDKITYPPHITNKFNYLKVLPSTHHYQTYKFSSNRHWLHSQMHKYYTSNVNQLPCE